MNALLCGLFFLSGAAALLFETLWFRQAGLALGNGVWASSLVLASFMAGLGLGNALAARYGARVRHPVRVYALLELGIAVTGASLVFALPSLTPALAPVLRPFLEWPALGNALRFAIGFGLLLTPATAMGATLPLLVGALRARDPSFGSALGRLYGWNTLGAVLGALIGELVLVEAFGLRGSAAWAAGANVAAALLAWTIGGRLAAARSDSAAVPRAALPPPAWRRLGAAFGAGGILLALEVVWFRFLHLFVHSGSAAFAWMLAVVLLGIGVGGMAAGAWLRRQPEAWRRAPPLALLAGALTALLYASFDTLVAPLGGQSGSAGPVVAAYAAALALPVSLLSGALFPLLGAALARDVVPETRAVGLLTLANTAGAALGPPVAAFLLLPLLGVERAIFGLAAAYGAVAWLAREPGPRSGPWLPRAAPLAFFLAALAAFPFGKWEGSYLQVPVRRWHRGAEYAVVGVREGPSETAVVVERRIGGVALNHALITESFAMSSTAEFARRYMELFVWWPVALGPDPRSALLVSYGVGVTASALVATPSLERIDVVDLSRDILALSDVIYRDPARHPLRDPRVHVHVEDGRHYLQLSERRYDLITGEPPPPKNAGIVNLYTREYFALLHARLEEGGIATYWLPVHNLLASDAKAITRAFCDVFTDCSMWVGHDLNWMLVGSRGARWPRDAARVEALWRDPTRAERLRALGFERPAQLGATFLADADWLRFWVGDTPALTDDFPKRLSDRLQRSAHAAFLPIMDVDAARARFASSAAVQAFWPPALFDAAREDFVWQRLVNEVGRNAKIGVAQRIEDVDRLLDEGLHTLVLWRLGVVAAEVDAVRQAIANGRPEAPFQRTLAVAALAEREFGEAARRLAEARTRAPGDARLLYLELYALCRGRRVQEADTLVRLLAPQLPRDADSRRFWHFLSDRFDLAGPHWAIRPAPGPADAQGAEGERSPES